MPELTYLEAINAALHDEMEADPRVFCLGEDVGRQGGAFGATKGLQQRFGVRGIPSLVLIAGGSERDRVVGALGHDALRTWLESRLTPAAKG